jgi:hypothetical protein
MRLACNSVHRMSVCVSAYAHWADSFRCLILIQALYSVSIQSKVSPSPRAYRLLEKISRLNMQYTMHTLSPRSSTILEFIPPLTADDDQSQSPVVLEVVITLDAPQPRVNDLGRKKASGK